MAVRGMNKMGKIGKQVASQLDGDEADRSEKIRALIEGKSQKELAQLLLSLVDRFPELRQEFSERIALSEGDVGRLTSEARRELRNVASEPAWRNSWNDEGNTPDYSRFKHRLERLLELGHADAVVELGREAIVLAMRQVGESHDEGETAMEVGECLKVVFDAAAQSSLNPAEKILFAIDALLADDYDIVGESADKIVDAKWPAAEWSAVADALAARIEKERDPAKEGRSEDFSRNYQRDGLTGWLASALEHAARHDEIRTIFEAEAKRTGSYERLVKYLIERGQIDDAERWAREGIEKTRAKLPGIANSLARSLCDLAGRRKQWAVVAAHAAAEFFEHPSMRGFNELTAAAKKARCEEPVRAMSLSFLETGVSPIEAVRGKNDAVSLQVDSGWPLPVPDYLAPRLPGNPRVSQTSRPHLNVLLDMAIAAKKPDEVLHWYDKMTAGEKGGSAAWGRYPIAGDNSNRVAEAVSKSHPERAAEIYRRGLNAVLPHAEIPAYQSAASCLRKLLPVMEAMGRKQEWSDLLEEIRAKYRNRPRFMELLDKLGGPRAVAAQKPRRR